MSFTEITLDELSDEYKEAFHSFENVMNSFYERYLMKIGFDKSIYGVERFEDIEYKIKNILFSYDCYSQKLKTRIRILFIIRINEKDRKNMYVTIAPTNTSWVDINVDKYIEDKYKEKVYEVDAYEGDGLKEKLSKVLERYEYYLKNDENLNNAIENKRWIDGYDSFSDYK